MSKTFEHFSPSVFGLIFAFCTVVFKIHSGMANSVDPNQTREQSDLGLHCLHIQFCQTLWCTKF